MTIDTSQWRSSPAYEFVDELAAPDLAWEWLRRNRDYQQDYANAPMGAGDAGYWAKALRRRWGLTFPGRSKAERDRGHRLLGSGSGPGHHSPHRNSSGDGLVRRPATA